MDLVPSQVQIFTATGHDPHSNENAFSGTEFTDTVTLAPGLVIPAQSIGVASTVSISPAISYIYTLFSLVTRP